jgi:hypothetical protein
MDHFDLAVDDETLQGEARFNREREEQLIHERAFYREGPGLSTDKFDHKRLDRVSSVV